MCSFLDGSHLLPGYGCCHCRSYNGLQRAECRACGAARCTFLIPSDVKRCGECGFGYREADVKLFQGGICPVCKGRLAA